jgi:hypothetical protein
METWLIELIRVMSIGLDLCEDYTFDTEPCTDCTALITDHIEKKLEQSSNVGVPDELSTEFYASGIQFIEVGIGFMFLLSIITILRVFLWIIKTTSKLIKTIF